MRTVQLMLIIGLKILNQFVKVGLTIHFDLPRINGKCLFLTVHVVIHSEYRHPKYDTY